MGVHHDIGGVGVGFDTFQPEFSNVPGPGRKLQVFTIIYIDTVKLQTLVIFAFLQGEMEENFKDRAEKVHHSNLDETNANDPLLYISIEYHWF